MKAGNDQCPFYIACVCNQVAVAQFLLSLGAERVNVEQYDDYRRSPFYAACKAGRYDVRTPRLMSWPAPAPCVRRRTQPSCVLCVDCEMDVVPASWERQGEPYQQVRLYTAVSGSSQRLPPRVHGAPAHARCQRQH